MQPNMLHTAVLVASFLLSGVAAENGYVTSCNSVGLCDKKNCKGVYSLKANCKTKSGIYTVGVWLDLDQCLTNDNGWLKGPNGA